MKTTRMPKELKEKWTAALRSGEYKQGKGVLRDENGAYCCMGVLQMIVDGEVETSSSDSEQARGYPSQEWLAGNGIICLQNASWYGVKEDILLGDAKASAWNDARDRSFPEIADLIDEYVEGV